MASVELAADLGYGVPWLTVVLTSALVIATAFFVYVVLSTKSNHVSLKGLDKVKYELNKYHAERYWGIFVAGLLIWFWVLGYPWMPPVAFNTALQQSQNVHIVKVTAGQWYWMLEDGGYSQNANDTSINTNNNQLYVKAGETVKFVARSIDVNHGFGVLSSSNQMDVPLFQMQVVPGYDNVFYYTFKNSETCTDICHYTIRCLEYCGWNHPYMVSSITIHAV
jgi:heme/copper-type cytochrome/quinol oxidase subunit 2